jgi:four helix bundle protein
MTQRADRPIRSYRDLQVWRRATDLVVEIYMVSSRFPSTERFGLTAQIRRAAVSVAASIAEGHERGGRAEFVQFVSMSRGSLAELETELTIAMRLQFVSSDDAEIANNLSDQVGRMLNRLHKRLRLGVGG